MHLRERQYLNWRESGEERGILLLPDEVDDFLRLAEEVSLDYAFEQITGHKVAGKHNIILTKQYILFNQKG